MKTFLVIFLSVLLGGCVSGAPTMSRAPLSYVDTTGEFCRENSDGSIQCQTNDNLTCYSHDDNTMIIQYIIELNRQCKKWKK